MPVASCRLVRFLEGGMVDCIHMFSYVNSNKGLHIGASTDWPFFEEDAIAEQALARIAPHMPLYGKIDVREMIIHI